MGSISQLSSLLSIRIKTRIIVPTILRRRCPKKIYTDSRYLFSVLNLNLDPQNVNTMFSSNRHPVIEEYDSRSVHFFVVRLVTLHSEKNGRLGEYSVMYINILDNSKRTRSINRRQITI